MSGLWCALSLVLLRAGKSLLVPSLLESTLQLPIPAFNSSCSFLLLLLFLHLSSFSLFCYVIVVFLACNFSHSLMFVIFIVFLSYLFFLVLSLVIIFRMSFLLCLSSPFCCLIFPPPSPSLHFLLITCGRLLVTGERIGGRRMMGGKRRRYKRVTRGTRKNEGRKEGN